jgi:hypothetical protein
MVNILAVKFFFILKIKENFNYDSIHQVQLAMFYDCSKKSLKAAFTAIPISYHSSIPPYIHPSTHDISLMHFTQNQ